MHPLEVPIPADADDAALTQAVERNTAELLLRMGDAGGGHRRDDEVSWTIGGSPLDYHNAVVAARLDDHSADAAIRDSRRELRRAELPGSWHVGPSMRPADLRARLERAGFAADGDEPGMVAPLHGRALVHRRAADLEIEVVRDRSCSRRLDPRAGQRFRRRPARSRMGR